MSMLFKRIKDWATSITAFRTGDVIPVDGPDGTAKMSKDDLLTKTAENSLSAICERYDSTKQYDAGAVFYVGNTIYQAKRNTANVIELYIKAYADPVPLDELIAAIFNRDKNVVTFFVNVGLFILSDGREISNSSMATTDYISVEGMTSLFVRTHFGNQWGGGVVCYDGEKNFVGSIHDDGDGGYDGTGTLMERTFAPADLPAGTQYVRVCRVINQGNYSYVVVNGVEGGVVADKIGFDKVADKFTDTKNYVQGQIISDKGEVAVCNSHLFGGDIDWSKFDKTSLGALVEKIFANGYKLVEDFPYRDKFVNSTGNESSANFFEVTQYTSLTGVDGIVALGSFGNQYGGGLAFYDKNFNFISCIHDDGSGQYPDVNNQELRTFTSADFPAGSAYVRLTNRYGSIYKKPYMFLFGSAMRGGEVAKREMVNVDRCCKWLANHVASLTTNGVLSIPKSPNTKNNYTISASAEFSTFGRISLYHGTRAYILGHIEIDDTNLYEYNYENGNLLSTTPHGLTMSDYVNVTLSVGQLFGAKAHLVLATGTQKYIKDVEWSGCNDDIKLKSVSGTYTNCSVKLSGAGYRMDTWVFGDSYCDMWPDKLLDLKSDARFMIDSYSGRGSFDAYWSLISDLRIGYKPKRIVWAMGMNNADRGAVNADWKTIFDRVKALCEKIGIDFIPCTIPCTPTRDNSYKNAYIASNCTEYIDMAGCVGATAQGSTWFAGLLASDNVHPSSAGQYVIANEMLGYIG